MGETEFVSRWEIMLSLFLNSGSIFNREVMCFRNEFESVKAIQESSAIRQTLMHWIENLKTNNTEDSNSLREEGNKILKKGNYFGACELYTRAIYAGKSSIESSYLAHANRAYALMQKEFYQEAYDDCECALNLGYPPSKAHKVVLRKADCSLLLNEPDKLESTAKDLKGLSENDLYFSKVKEKLSILQEQQLKCSKSKKCSNTVHNSKGEKRQILCNSLAKGTYVIAAEKILPDEEITTERAFAFVPLYNNVGDTKYIDHNCHNCAESKIIPFPCYSCRQVSYCSTKCRDLHERIHKFECPGYKKQLFNEIGVAHLAFRVLLVGFQNVLQYMRKNNHINTDKISSLEIWKEILKYSENETDPYAHVIRLVCNLDKLDPEDLLRYALTASMLVCYLRKYTTFFSEIQQQFPEQSLTTLDWDIVIGTLLVRHIGQMICNAHTITGMKLNESIENFWAIKNLPKPGTLHCFERAKLFAALFPKISLYNHSCEPIFYNRFDGSNLTVRSLKNLQINNEIFNCYGINYKIMDKLSRTAALKAQYAFDCKCKHCEGDDEKFKTFHTYMCTNASCKKPFTPDPFDYHWWRKDEIVYKIQCSFCGSDFDLRWFLNFEAMVLKFHQTEKLKIKDFYSAYEFYKNVQNILVGPHELKRKMVITMLTEFIDLPNDELTVSYLLRLSIDLLKLFEAQYGFHSLEFVQAGAYFLDLIALQEVDKKNSMKLEYNMRHILDSFKMLSTKDELIFQNYFKKYIEAEK